MTAINAINAIHFLFVPNSSSTWRPRVGLDCQRLYFALEGYFVGIRCSTSSTIPAKAAHYGTIIIIIIIIIIKDKLMPNGYAGVYELKCSCGSVYNGETKKNH